MITLFIYFFSESNFADCVGFVSFIVRQKCQTEKAANRQ